MAEEILPGAAERAAVLLADVAEQRWEQATSGFDQRMAKALDARGLRVELSHESPFARLLVSVRDPESALAVIRGATGI